MSAATTSSTAIRHRPKSLTVFAAAFIAGAAAAVGVNRVLDVHLAQRRPQVECEPIFVALRPLPQGASVTVWDVALKDWPKAMLPSSALRAGDSFDGFVLRHAVREGQPLLAVQLIRSGPTPQASVAGESFIAPNSTSTQADPWMPAESLAPPATTPVARTKSVVAPPSPAIEPPAQAVTSTPTPIAAQPMTPEPTPMAVAAAEPAASTPAAEPAAKPAAEPARAAAPPATAIAATSEPTPAEPTAVAAARQPIPPSPTDIDPPSPRRPSIAVADPNDEAMEEAVATDVQSMPSVMTSAGQSSGQSAGQSSAAAGDAGRYLVVPERIALQADTSFTTPRPEPPGPPAVKAATRQPSRTPAPPAGQPPARRGQQPARGQPASGQPARGQQQPQSQQPATAEQPRTWSGMFPNVAAGIEAMGGSWQRSRSGPTQPAAGNQSTRR
jgi:hypothetical protein